MPPISSINWESDALTQLFKSTTWLRAAPSRALVSSSAASGKPISAKTLSVPRMTSSLAISLLVILLCQLQARFDQSNVGLPGSNSMRRLFLKCVQNQQF
jgi:hypothetical protein